MYFQEIWAIWIKGFDYIDFLIFYKKTFLAGLSNEKCPQKPL